MENSSLVCDRNVVILKSYSFYLFIIFVFCYYFTIIDNRIFLCKIDKVFKITKVLMWLWARLMND